MECWEDIQLVWSDLKVSFIIIILYFGSFVIIGS
jgi:hypothetical protein